MVERTDGSIQATEWDLLEVLWEKERSTAREVARSLRPRWSSRPEESGCLGCQSSSRRERGASVDEDEAARPARRSGASARRATGSAGGYRCEAGLTRPRRDAFRPSTPPVRGRTSEHAAFRARTKPCTGSRRSESAGSTPNRRSWGGSSAAHERDRARATPEAVGRAIREVRGAVEINVAVVPRASRSRVVGTLGDRIKVQLAAPPVDGAANVELVALLADLIGVPARSIAIVRGETHKRKTVRISGIDAAACRERLEAVIRGSLERV
jgi:uncharacterized protein